MNRILIVGLCLPALAAPAWAEVVEVRRGDLTRPERAIYDRLQALGRQKTQLMIQRSRFTTTSTKAGDAAITAVDAKLRDTRRSLAATILGDGFDVWHGSKKFMQCVSFRPTDVTMHPYVPESDANGDNVYQVRRISSLADHYASRNQGGSITATYKVFSIGAGASEYSADTHHSESRYIDAYVVTLGDRFTLDGGEPSREALRKLSSTVKGAFASACGQAFVSKVGFGTKLDGEVAFEIEIDSDTKTNQNDVTLGIQKILFFGANWGKSVQDMTQKSTIATRIWGGGGERPDPEAFLGEVQKFGKASGAVNSVEPVLIDVTPYNQLASSKFDAFADVGGEAEGVLHTFIDSRLAALQALGDLHQARPKIAFYNASLTDVDESITKQMAYLTMLSDLYAVCSKALTPDELTTCKSQGTAVGTPPPVLSLTLK